MHSNIKSLILAAGQGTRMNSDLPKVLHSVAYQPMLNHVIKKALCYDEHPVVIVKHQAQLIESYVNNYHSNCYIAKQSVQNGTGAAVIAGIAKIEEIINQNDLNECNVLILSGDCPLTDQKTLNNMCNYHLNNNCDITILTTEFKNPFGYGRIIRKNEDVIAIVEESDATNEQKKVNEVNGGIYFFKYSILKKYLPLLKSSNKQDELYLTDVIELACQNSQNVKAFLTSDSDDIFGINDKIALSIANKKKFRSICEFHALNGVNIEDLDNTYIGEDVVIEKDVVIEHGCHIEGNTKIMSGSIIMQNSRIIDSIIDCAANIGPFAYLRKGTEVGASGKIGAFVETKNSQIGKNSKVPHLSYVGDATIGENTNIGAGTIFANYDGVNKSHTEVGSNSKIGSKTVLVAPVKVGDNVYTGAGSLVRSDIEDDALAYSKNDLKIVENWTKENR